LKANASSPRDTVFLEPLGYIGFFSNLKMYDYPGLCSPEVVAVRKRIPHLGYYTEHWPELIGYLTPDWVVMRSSEVESLKQNAPELLTKYYRLERIFDVSQKIKAVGFLPGRNYLLFDSHFEIYRRNPEIAAADFPITSRITVPFLSTNQAWTGSAYFSNGHIAAHAPSRIGTTIPTAARSVSGKFGFFPGSYENPQDSTDGAIFVVQLVLPDGKREEIYSALIHPRDQREHRGDQKFAVPIPASDAKNLEFSIAPLPGKSNAYGWTYWKDLQFELEREPLD
jgi:hypothetical protein